MAHRFLQHLAKKALSGNRFHLLKCPLGKEVTEVVGSHQCHFVARPNAAKAAGKVAVRVRFECEIGQLIAVSIVVLKLVKLRQIAWKALGNLSVFLKLANQTVTSAFDEFFANIIVAVVDL